MECAQEGRGEALGQDRVKKEPGPCAAVRAMLRACVLSTDGS